MKRARHIKMTEREYKARKRREFKELKKALDKFRYGCTYMPQDALEILFLGRMDKTIDKAHDVLKKWWKNA